MADEEEELDDTDELCPECGESIEDCECEDDEEDDLLIGDEEGIDEEDEDDDEIE